MTAFLILTLLRSEPGRVFAMLRRPLIASFVALVAVSVCHGQDVGNADPEYFRSLVETMKPDSEASLALAARILDSNRSEKQRSKDFSELRLIDSDQSIRVASTLLNHPDKLPSDLSKISVEVLSSAAFTAHDVSHSRAGVDPVVVDGLRKALLLNDEDLSTDAAVKLIQINDAGSLALIEKAASTDGVSSVKQAVARNALRITKTSNPGEISSNWITNLDGNVFWSANTRQSGCGSSATDEWVFPIRAKACLSGDSACISGDSEKMLYLAPHGADAPDLTHALSMTKFQRTPASTIILNACANGDERVSLDIKQAAVLSNSSRLALLRGWGQRPSSRSKADALSAIKLWATGVGLVGWLGVPEVSDSWLVNSGESGCLNGSDREDSGWKIECVAGQPARLWIPDQQSTDAWITDKVKSELLAESATAEPLSVFTFNGVVTLNGKFEKPYGAEMAVALAEKVNGVNFVMVKADPKSTKDRK